MTARRRSGPGSQAPPRTSGSTLARRLSGIPPGPGAQSLSGVKVAGKTSCVSTRGIPLASAGRAVAAQKPAHRRSVRALQLFMLVVLAHWVEHVVQALQVFVFGWERPEARGALGFLVPWLVSSEALHYGYAVVMLFGLALLRPAFSGVARHWWDAALVLQVWHHLEHLLLLSQVAAGQPFFGAQQPTSVIQMLVPRIELHLAYNAIVFTPMVVALWLQFAPQHPAPHRASAQRTTS